ncbi:beta-ketoacyl synthase N-terminal-like domain-containing protein [Amycolatopsis sp.]|uniref:beta-ketoacyl synthase N-terminal-like domain-containing protein n=1 Tax=Amycolatopsis sp. TaxID=37632 RepID=UPI002C5F5F58|nr:beta-ketoacyl synthase N-terminal-like domain-containing protein [Amycolatopsis sp.]HVV13311.1 beta-ketoacyl synthase N-terminal-like domain-containing protein [Amycolatopsis sp.]
MNSREIGICGIGAVTGYGWSREQFWDGLRAGKHAATLVGGYGSNRDETVWLARVADGGNPTDGPSRFAKAMRAAAREAIADAGARGWQPGKRVGLLHAVVLGEVDLWREFYLERNRDLRPREYLGLMPSTPMSTFMQEYGFHGPAMNVSAMCASGNAGLLTAKAWLDAGIVDDVVFVATDLSATPENVLHFVRLGVAAVDQEPSDVCRPFQEGSRGFGFGEASVSFVLSRSAERPYALALGGAMSHDGYHVTSVDPGLDQVRDCFQQALDNAGVPASAVKYFNAHGPGTAQCDRAESTILAEFFGPETGIYSVKPLVGHCQGAASAVEMAVAAMSYDRGYVPAPVPVAPGHPQLLSGRTPVGDGLTVKSSLGMGGHNSVVVLAPPA